MMAKIKFRRSSRNTVTQQKVEISGTSGSDDDGFNENKNAHLRGDDNDKKDMVSEKQQNLAAKKSAASDNNNKGNKRRKHPALRIFYLSPSAPSTSSTNNNNAKEAASTSTASPSVSIINSTTLAPNAAKLQSTTDVEKKESATPIPLLKTTKGRKKTMNEKPMKQESSINKSSRLFASRLSTSSASTAIGGGSSSGASTVNGSGAAAAPLSSANAQATSSANASNHQLHITTNSSNKQVISIPLPPYEIEVTEIDGLPYIECPLCVLLVNYQTTPDLRTCSHRTCLECMQRYLKTEINHSRLKITCPICSEPLQQQVIRETLHDDKFYFKYESFMLRKVLAAEPDARWCPAPDCGYAVLATGCASCPRLVCGRDGCKTEFCYHCKQEWHPNQTCSAASIQRNKRSGFVLNAFNISDLISSADENAESGSSASDPGISSGNNKDNINAKNNNNGKNGRKSSRASQQAGATGATPASSSLKPEDIKECPVCSSRIIKMNDGSCNHMTCSICDTDFCWLCMKEISDLHYFSPSGCTFWGKKPWSRKKKLLWRLGMLVGAPICIVFIAGIAVPAIVIGIPVWAARKLHTRLEKKQFSRYRKNAIITGGVLLSFLVSPIISAMALAVGIPILLGYVYGVVPLSLCRSSGGCLSSNPSVENLNEIHQQQQQLSSATTSSSVVNQARDQLQRLQIQAAQQEFKRQQLKSDLSQLKSRNSDSNNKNIEQIANTSNNSSIVDQATPPPYSDIVSVDTATNSKQLEVEGTSASNSGNNNHNHHNQHHHHGGSSIGEPSMYLSNISLETNSIGNATNVIERSSRNSASATGGCGLSSTGCEDRESASNVALSGSILSHKADDAQSTRALAGSIVSKESGGYTLVPAEVHSNSIEDGGDDDDGNNEPRKTSSSIGATTLAQRLHNIINSETKEKESN